MIPLIDIKEVDSIWNDARKTIPEDSSNQIISIKEDDLAVVTIGKLVRGTKKWAYLKDLLNISNVQVKEVDLEKEIIRISKNEYFDFTDWKSIARHFFELGLKAKNEIINKIEDKLDFYCDRPSEFYGAIEKMIKELKGE